MVKTFWYMDKIFFLFILISSFCHPIANAQIRSVDELVDAQKTGLSVVESWISEAENKVEVLNANADNGRDALFKTQVTTKSPMGAIIFYTGGILIDSGFIRILGSGSERLTRSLPDWNKGKTFNNFGDKPTYLLVADDALGGFFALNGNGLGDDPGNMYYLSPDDLVWESLGITYSDFLQFRFNGNLQEFYADILTRELREKALRLSGDQVLSFYPPLWSTEIKDTKDVFGYIKKRHRRVS